MKNIFKSIDLFKMFLSKYFVVNEIITNYFFTGANNYSRNDLSIRYGLFSKNINRLSPFSRFSAGIIDEKRKILLFYSYKCGASSIRAFSQLELKLGAAKTQSIAEAHRNPVSMIINFKAKKTQNWSKKVVYWNTYKSYQKYLIVRDPYERLISYYKHMLINTQGKHVGANKLELKHIAWLFRSDRATDFGVMVPL
jgi:hypothetical protein